MSVRKYLIGLVVLVDSSVVSVAQAGDDPFADSVIEFVPGIGGAAGYDDPIVVLGAPERVTGEAFGSPAVVTPFSPPYGTDEIVSVGAGGSITVRFNTPILNDAENPFGIDLIVFGNAGFLDAAFPSGIVGGLFGDDGGSIELSADGESWFAIPGVFADGFCPTAGYADGGPYDAEPGEVEADFTLPVDPSIVLADMVGMSHDEVLATYAGSGGGVRIDISVAGLDAVSFVRITHTGASGNVEIDALSDVATISTGPDLDGDGDVAFSDLLIVLAAWGDCRPESPCAADIDRSGEVGFADLLLILAAWST